ncbi:MAG: GFA family protein [Luminiphilus sp.]|nr:GFA family protein [Luminiphilus sp.]
MLKDIDGRCLCGDIHWEASVNPELVGVCHCTDCQTVGGSAFQFTARVSRDHFTVLSGALSVYEKVAESGNPRAMSFCGRCATMIHTGNTDATDLLSLRLGGCRQRYEFMPRFQIWCQSALSWATFDSGTKVPDQGIPAK